VRKRLSALVILATLYVACGGGGGNQPPPPPGAVTHPTGLVAVDELSTPLEGATCSVAGKTGATNGDGYTLISEVPEGQQNASCTKEGYEMGSAIYFNDHNQNVQVILIYVVPIPQLASEGQHFISGGAPFTAIESSDFLLYQRYLNGENVRPIIEQRMTIGFNMLRVFGMYNGSLGHFIPSDYGDNYYTALPGFMRLLAHYHLYVEFTAFADATMAMPVTNEQLTHWNRLVATLDNIPNVLLEVGNELDQPINRLASLGQLPRPVHVFSSHGSNGSQAQPVLPHWDYATFHTNDAPEWQRKVGHNAMEIWQGPTLANENTRAPDRFSAEALAFDAAAGGSLLAAGSCFHSIHGRSSELFDPAEVVLAQQWVNGARSIPLSCQRGAYRRRDDLLGAGVLRAYQRGDDPACIVLIRN
jgi:hypothetical protein